jgi:hypothetical protein
MKFSLRHMLKPAVAACSAVFVAAAAPAFANTANSATTSADIIEPVREAQGDVVDTGDQRFKSLFSSWTAIERTTLASRLT